MKKHDEQTPAENVNKTAEDKKIKRKLDLNTLLIVISVILLVTGVICLLIEPIKSSRRNKITNDALDEIEAQISEQSELTLEETAITFVVPRDGNEVAGESIDYYGDEEAIISMQEQVAEEEANLPSNVTLTCVGILQIDDIELELPVWDSSSRVALRYGLGLYEYSVMPGEQGNSTILGHRNRHTSTMFYRLKEVEVGDVVRFIKTDGTELVFTVDEVRIVGPDELLDNIDGDITDTIQLTLVTCANGENGYGSGYRRLVICHMSQED